MLPVVDLPVLEKRFTSCEGLLKSVHLDKSFQNLVSALNQSKAMADLSLKEKNDSSPLFEETTPKDFQFMKKLLQIKTSSPCFVKLLDLERGIRGKSVNVDFIKSFLNKLKDTVSTHEVFQDDREKLLDSINTILEFPNMKAHPDISFRSDSENRFIDRFNADPTRAMNETAQLQKSNDEILAFFNKNVEKLNPFAVYTYLSSNSKFAPLLIEKINTTGKTLSQSIRDFCKTILFKPNTSYEPFVEAFSQRYLDQHPNEFGPKPNKKSITLLFWYLFNLAESVPQEKIPKEEWVNQCFNDIQKRVPLTKIQLGTLYDEIVDPKNPIKFNYVHFKPNPEKYEENQEFNLFL